MGLKRGERRDIAQGDRGFQERPKEVLRATQISSNDAARASNLVIFPNMRVPDRSIIHEVFTGSRLSLDWSFCLTCFLFLSFKASNR
jgi:hypothetical protein